MKIDRLVVGKLETNCYIITKNDKTIIIDPGDDADKIINFCKDKDVVAILVTHYHFDHIGALEKVKDYFAVPINPSSVIDFCYEIIKTPGHKEDCLTFYFKEDKVMFDGDFIFYNSIGRMDLEGGNILDMQKSLKLISKYDDDVILYPGHGPHTLLGKEKGHFKFYF